MTCMSKRAAVSACSRVGKNHYKLLYDYKQELLRLCKVYINPKSPGTLWRLFLFDGIHYVFARVAMIFILSARGGRVCIAQFCCPC